MAHHHHHHHGEHHQQQQQHSNDDDVPQDGYDLEAANKKKFDEMAKTHDAPASMYLTEYLADGIYARFLKELDGSSATLVDYACGPGSVSFHLLKQGRVNRIVGADVSSGMIDVFNEKARSNGYTEAQAKGVVVSKHGLEESLNGELFDVVICNHAYHHFDDVAAVTSKLAAVLKSGGLLIVADWLASDAKPSGNEKWAKEAKEHGVKHLHGFTEQALESHFKNAGLLDVKIDTSFGVSKRKLADLGAMETPLKNIIGDMEARPDIQYILAAGKKA